MALAPSARFDPYAPPPELPRFGAGARIALDLETRDPNLDVRGPGWCFPGADGEHGEIVGVGIAWEGGQFYAGLRHRGGGNVPDPAGFLRWLAGTLANPDLTVVVHNYGYDLGWLRRAGIPVRGRVVDTRLAAPLLNEYRRSYHLDALALEYLGVGKDERRLREYCAGMRRPDGGRLHPKKDLWRLPAWIVSEYGATDARRTYDLWDVLEPLIAAEDLGRALALELRLAPMLLEMRWRGIRVDLDAAERARTLFTARAVEAKRRVATLVGFPIDVWNAEEIARAMDARGIAYPLTPKTRKPSFTQGWLNAMAEAEEFCRLLVEGRKAEKLVSTYIDGYVLDKAVRTGSGDYRVHPQLHQLKSDEGGTVTSRFSASDPNVTNPPNPEKDWEAGTTVRGFFLPEEGASWAALDYSQQEPRIAVHVAFRLGIRGAAKAVRAYRENAALDFHGFLAALTGLPRVYAKQINLGIGYGMGGAKLCRALGLPTKLVALRNRDRVRLPSGDWLGEEFVDVEVAGDEGKAILDQYHRNAPFMKGVATDLERKAETRGYVKLLDGRRCHFRLNGRRYDFPYKAFNRVCQGSAAVQTKQAMLDLWDAGEVPHVPVHDELGTSVADPEHAARLARTMEEAWPLEVPSKVDVELGPNWGATVKLKD